MAKRILVIDDEEDFITMIEVRLSAHGYEILTAFNGMDGLKKTRDEKPDLIILDLNMPKLDGYQTCRMIKFDNNLKKIPIIMLTALGQKEDREWGKKVKADAYLTKPYNPDELLERIKGFIGDAE